MFRRFFRTVGPFLPVLFIAIPAMWPFLVNASLPAATDAELHIFRLAELSRLLRAGELYPRWAPNFYFGYGYPIFNYYAPFSYYFGFLFDILPGINPVGATKTVFLFGLLTGGVGTFGFVRNRWGAIAGYTAAALFLYAPYIQYIDPHARGVLAESFSLGLFPLALWLLDRLQRRPSGVNFALAAFAVAAMVLSHNLMAMIGSGIILAWIIWQWLRLYLFPFTHPTTSGTISDEAAPEYRILRTEYPMWSLTAAFIIGLLLSMFFWLPLGLERNAVNLNTLVGEEGSHFAFSNHFLSWRDLLGFSWRLDWGATEPAYRFNVGFVQWLITLLALLLFGVNRLFEMTGLSLYRESKRDRQTFLFWGIVLGGLLFLLFPISTFVWRTVPVMPFIQFPWRLLGPLAFVLAVLGGYLIRSRTAAFITIGLTMVFAMPLTQVRPWEPFGATDIAAVAFQETRGRWLGTTSTADFLPATVEVIPGPEPLVMDVLRQNGLPERINRYTVPKEADIQFEPLSALHFRYQIDSPKPFQFRLYLFQFPGWWVTLNGAEIEPDLGRPEGFIVVPLEAGQHTIEVGFGSTPARRWGWVLSGVGLLALLTISFLGMSNRVETAENEQSSDFRFGLQAAGGILLLFVALNLFGPWWHVDSAGGPILVADRQLRIDFGDQIALLGVDLPQNLQPGDQIELTLYWQAHAELDIDYQVFVHLLDANGEIVIQSDKLNPGDFPTGRWPTDRYVRDPHQLLIPDDLAGGQYRLTTGLWLAEGGGRLAVTDENGDSIGDVYKLQAFEWE